MSGVLIITGGSRGIGAATAVCAARNGWDVAINYASDAGSADAVSEQVSQFGRRSMKIQADMTNEDDIMRMFKAVENELGSIKGLVNSAGTTGKTARVEDMTASAIRGIMELNVIGLMLCCREAVKRMSTKNGGEGGYIVNVASAASRLGGPNEFVHYATSKGAVDSFTLGFSREVAEEGVVVNAVSPGMIDTEIHASAGLPNRAIEAAPGIPIRRVGKPEEVAEAIVWLLSPGASYCAGAILPITGGR